MDASVTLSLNDGPFAAGIARAEKHAQSFAGRVDGLSHRVERLFARDPGRRGEVAFIGLARSLAAGDVVGGIESITSRISGIGLIAGVAVGATVAIFQRFKGQIDQTIESERKLAVELDTIGGVRGPEQATSKLQAVKTATDDLIVKSDTLGTKFGNVMRDMALSIQFGKSGTLGFSAAAKADEIKAGLQGEAKLMDDRAGAEEKLVEIKNKALTLSEGQAALDKISFEAAIKRSSIDEEANKFKADLFKPELRDKIKPEDRTALIRASQAAAAREKASVDRTAGLSTQAEQQKIDIKGRALAVEEDEANMALGLVNVDKQRIAHLQNQLGLIQDQLGFTTQLTSEERKRLQVDETKAKAAINQERFTKFFQSPSDRLNESIQENRRQGAIKEFQRSGGLLDAHRDMGGKIISGIDPLTGNRVAPGQQSQDKSSQALTKGDLEEVMAKYWGG